MGLLDRPVYLQLVLFCALDGTDCGSSSSTTAMQITGVMTL